MIKRPNLRISGLEEVAEIQTKSIRNTLKAIIAENLTNL
jgi:hypothetical protein